MATVNNATGLYATLNYNFSDPNKYVIPLSGDAINHLNTAPPFIESWQAQAIINDETAENYFQNPMVTVTTSIINNSNTIIELSNNTTGLETIEVVANTLYGTSTEFLAHTNRLSGVTLWTGDDTVPYYDSAMNLGKIALYITNQTDAISNNSPILGSFTSILIEPQVAEQANNVLIYLNQISNSITSTVGTDPETGDPITSNTSNLTPTQITTITDGLNVASSLLSTRESADVTYYTNLKSFIDKYNSMKKFSNMGETQTYLINNFIGTPQLVSKIN